MANTEIVFRKEELTLILAVEPDSVAKGEELTETLPKTLGLSVRVAVTPGELVAPRLIDMKGEAVNIVGDALCEEDDVVLGVIEFVANTESVFRKEALAEKLPKTLGLSETLALRPGELVAARLIDIKGEAVKILGVSLCDALCEEDDVVVGVIEIVPTTEGVLRKEVLGLILVVEPDSVAKGEGLNEYKAVTLFAETLPKTLGLSVTLALILGEVVGPTLVDTNGEAVKILGVAR